MNTATGLRDGVRPALGVLLVVSASLFFAVNGTASKLVLRSGNEPSN